MRQKKNFVLHKRRFHFARAQPSMFIGPHKGVDLCLTSKSSFLQGEGCSTQSLSKSLPKLSLKYPADRSKNKRPRQPLPAMLHIGTKIPGKNRCYEFKNIFAEKFSENIGVFRSNYY
jgi:hypothetical protein